MGIVSKKNNRIPKGIAKQWYIEYMYYSSCTLEIANGFEINQLKYKIFQRQPI